MRRRSWLRSMRVRILAVVVSLLLLSSVGSVLLLRAVLFERLEQEVAVDLQQEAGEFELLRAGSDPQTGEPFDGDLSAIFDVYFAGEIPDEGESLLSFIDGEVYESRRAQDAAGAVELERATAYWLSLDRPENGSIDTPFGLARYVAIPLEGDGQQGLFVVANFPEYERREIDDAIRTAVVIQLGTMVVASLLGLALAGRVLRPLQSLAHTARRISDTDLTQRIPIAGRDEASQIAEAFNDMLGRLQEAFGTQRRFLEDTSHELRTPLTVIRGHVELLSLDKTPTERRETVALVTDEIDRMNGIVQDLMLLAQAVQPDFLHREPLDVRDLIVEVHRKATAIADRTWHASTPTATVVVADRRRLTQALLQLADNAAKHTAEGDVIEIGAGTAAGVVRLWVDDRGRGVSPEDAQCIFERFDRGSDGRATSGAGLGLAIVSAIAEAHGGTVALVTRPGPGARFEITLPLR